MSFSDNVNFKAPDRKRVLQNVSVSYEDVPLWVIINQFHPKIRRSSCFCPACKNAALGTLPSPYDISIDALG